MKHITIRYVSELDFSAELENLYKKYTDEHYKNILFHVYSGVLDKTLVIRVSEMLHSRFETDMVIGTISAGEINNGKLMDRGVLVSALMFESADVKVYRFPDATEREESIGNRICALADNTPECKALELMFPGTNLHTRTLFENIRDDGSFGIPMYCFVNNTADFTVVPTAPLPKGAELNVESDKA